MLDGKGLEAALPEVATPAFADIDAPGLAAMGLTEGAAETVCRFGHSNQMAVLGHKAVAPNLDRAGSTPLGHEFEVSDIVLLAKESLLSTITALGHVVGHSRDDDARQSGLAARLTQDRPDCQWLWMVSPESGPESRCQ